MTFIASVIAKKGVALIADSLVTSSKMVIEFDDFIEFIKSKGTKKDKEIKIEPVEIIDLFKVKPSHTKDYEEKLFKYDKYTAITTAGSASINGKNIEELINEAIHKLNPDSKNSEKVFEENVLNFKNFIDSEVKKHLKDKTSIRSTVFIITHYSKSTRKTIIYKLEVIASSQKDIVKPGYEYLSLAKQPEHYKVVCDGQNRISERILFGELDIILDIIPRIVKRMVADFKIPDDYYLSLIKDENIMTNRMRDDIKISKLTELSLQQAVDLACLLMRIEMDIQKYTENIPTVGGVVKIAVIDDTGFRFISGVEISYPDKHK